MTRTPIRPMPSWCADPGECGRLLRWLHEHDDKGPITMATVFEVLEKPWHWDGEYEAMILEQEAEQAAIRDRKART